MHTVRAKMRLQNVTQQHGARNFQFNAVYDSTDNAENKAFSDATPSADARLLIADGKPAGDMFVQGKDYYVDFIPVDETC